MITVPTFPLGLDPAAVVPERRACQVQESGPHGAPSGMPAELASFWRAENAGLAYVAWHSRGGGGGGGDTRVPGQWC